MFFFIDIITPRLYYRRHLILRYCFVAATFSRNRFRIGSTNQGSFRARSLNDRQILTSWEVDDVKRRHSDTV
jgi:hypothetical protein